MYTPEQLEEQARRLDLLKPIHCAQLAAMLRWCAERMREEEAAKRAVQAAIDDVLKGDDDGR